MEIPNRCLASCVLYLEECERKMNSFKGGISYDPSNKAWVIVGFTPIIGLFQRGCVNMCVNMCVNVCVNMFVNICVNICVTMCVNMSVNMSVNICVNMCVNICILTGLAIFKMIYI
jgi:hypothetical protein